MTEKDFHQKVAQELIRVADEELDKFYYCEQCFLV